MANEDARVREQIEYYRERAPEYDDWFYKRGRHDEGERRRREWQDETERAHRILRALGPVEEALELATGTGIWTERLLHVADRVTAVDSSPEVIELARRRVRSDPRVTFEVADLFAYRAARRFDLVSFTFWLSHVPPSRLPRFFALLQRSLRPAASCSRSTSGPRPTGRPARATGRSATWPTGAASKSSRSTTPRRSCRHCSPSTAFVSR